MTKYSRSWPSDSALRPSVLIEDRLEVFINFARHSSRRIHFPDKLARFEDGNDALDERQPLELFDELLFVTFGRAPPSYRYYDKL